MIPVEEKVFILHACKLRIMTSIITGASRGLGQAIAEKIAAAGHDLLLCSRNDTALRATTDQLGTQYPAITIRAMAADLAEKEEARRFGQWVVSTRNAR